GIRYRADGCQAGSQDHTAFAGWQLNDGILPIAGRQLGIRTCTACNRTALTGIQLDVVNDRTQGNVLQWQRVAYFRSYLITRDNGLPNLKSFRRQDITLLTVGVV